MINYIAFISFFMAWIIAILSIIISFIKKRRFSNFTIIFIMFILGISLVSLFLEPKIYYNCDKETITENLGEYPLKECILISDNGEINNAMYILKNVYESGFYSFEYIDGYDKKLLNVAEENIKVTITNSVSPHVVIYKNEEVPKDNFINFLVSSDKVISYQTYEIYVPTGTLLSIE